MNKPMTSTHTRDRLNALTRYTPTAASALALALGVGLTASGTADAALVIQTFNQTVSNGNFFFDLDQDGDNDYRVDDYGSRARIRSLFSTSDGIAGDATGSFALLLSEGASVDGSTFVINPDYISWFFDDAEGPFLTLKTMKIHLKKRGWRLRSGVNTRSLTLMSQTKL